MHILDSHFHYYPRPFFDMLARNKGKSYPCAAPDDKGGYHYFRQPDNGNYHLSVWAEWFDLDKQIEHMDRLGHRVDVVASIGPLSTHFSEGPKEVGRDH